MKYIKMHGSEFDYINLEHVARIVRSHDETTDEFVITYKYEDGSYEEERFDDTNDIDALKIKMDELKSAFYNVIELWNLDEIVERLYGAIVDSGSS